jgi:hypothetical protein
MNNKLIDIFFKVLLINEINFSEVFLKSISYCFNCPHHIKSGTVYLLTQAVDLILFGLVTPKVFMG